MSWVAVGTAVATTAATAGTQKLLGGDDKGTVSQQPQLPAFQSKIAELLSGFVEDNQGVFKPGADFPGLSKLTTPTGIEQISIDNLKNFVQSGDPAILGLAGNEVSKTLTGQYDPTKSDFYKSSREAIAKNTREQQNEFKNLLAATGQRGSSGGIRGQREIVENSINSVNQLIGQLTENERVRRLSTAVPQALNIANLTNSIKQGKLASGFEFGSLSRLLEQFGYNDFLRKQQEGKDVQNIGLGVLGKSVPYGVNSVDYANPSGISQLIGTAAEPLIKKSIENASTAIFT